MKDFCVKHCRSIAAMSILVLAITIFVSCISPNTALIGNSTSSKGDDIAMKTLQTNAQIEHVNAGNFNEKVLQSNVPVLVDFYAEWCGPCKALAPVLEEVAQETSGVKIVKVNVDENYELATRYGIQSIPSLFVFNNSQIVKQHVGLANKQGLKQLLAR
jgi:thioredoxin